MLIEIQFVAGITFGGGFLGAKYSAALIGSPDQGLQDSRRADEVTQELDQILAGIDTWITRETPDKFERPSDHLHCLKEVSL